MWKILKNIKNIGLSINVAIPTFGICDYFSGSCIIALALLLRLYIVLLSRRCNHMFFLELEGLNRRTRLLGHGNLENEMSHAASELARSQGQISGWPPHSPPGTALNHGRGVLGEPEHKAEVIPHDRWRLRVSSPKPPRPFSERQGGLWRLPSLSDSQPRLSVASLISRLAHGAILSEDSFLLCVKNSSRRRLDTLSYS